MAKTKEEIGWLLEWDGPTYWGGLDFDYMTSDPNLAVRFARQCDAKKVQFLVLNGDCRVVEHMWL